VHPTTNCCPSQQTTQCSPAAPRIWNSLPITIRTASTTNTFRRHLKTHLFSATPPSTNCYHPHLRFELLFWHTARYKCRLLTYLLTVHVLISKTERAEHLIDIPDGASSTSTLQTTNKSDTLTHSNQKPSFSLSVHCQAHFDTLHRSISVTRVRDILKLIHSAF